MSIFVWLEMPTFIPLHFRLPSIGADFPADKFIACVSEILQVQEWLQLRRQHLFEFYNG